MTPVGRSQRSTDGECHKRRGYTSYVEVEWTARRERLSSSMPVLDAVGMEDRRDGMIAEVLGSCRGD